MQLCKIISRIVITIVIILCINPGMLTAESVASQSRWKQGFIQAWNENMQDGISRLNMEPQQGGVTPINGALLIPEADLSLPGRGGAVPVLRFYSSKIWAADSSMVKGDSSAYLLSRNLWTGTGWNFHFGKVWAVSDSGMIYEQPGGLQVYFKKKYQSNDYLSTDGSYLLLHYFGNQDSLEIRTDNGGILRFARKFIQYDVPYFYLTKITDANGNVTGFYYSIYSSSYLRFDSLLTSTKRRLTAHYHLSPCSWNDYPYYLLDSLKYKGFNNVSLKIAYHYDTTQWTNKSPFDTLRADNEQGALLLKSVVYPDLDSVYYDYNEYFELTAVHTRNNGVVNYAFETYNYYKPGIPVYLPTDEVYTTWIKWYTRAVKKTIADDPWSSPDTTIYTRVFSKTGNPPNAYETAITNPDSVMVRDPEGNYQCTFFRAGCREYEAPSWGVTKGLATYGMLDSTVIYNKGGRNLGTTIAGPAGVTKIPPDSISVPKRSLTYDRIRYYGVRYYDYDEVGNPRLIKNLGDTLNANDDYWTHKTYAHNDDSATFWLKVTAQIDEPPMTATASFYSLQGIDTLIFKRQWGNSSTGPWDSLYIDTLVYNPAYKKSETASLSWLNNDTFCKVTITAKQINSPESLQVYAVYNLLASVIVDDDSSYKIRDEHLNKRLFRLVTSETISSDSAGTNVLAQNFYFYDDTANIVKTYTNPAPVKWQTPAVPCNIRGNLTRIQQWKGGTDYTKNELRYDQVGNVVYANSHATANAAETTFSYYDKPNDSLYAYPWRLVNHVSTSVCSLYTRTEYDSATGLVKKTFDTNEDSTVFAYDSLSRIRKIWQPNEDNPSVIKRYYKDDPVDLNPVSVLDSVKLDSRWLVSKSFLDGFSRLIQTKQYRTDTTVIQNITYDGNGLKDSVGNPYEVTGTISYDYTAPSWSDITYFEYDGVGRDTLITHPDTKKIRIKYHAYADTVYDEKNNKTIYSKNAFGLIDTLTDASGNKTFYQYDKLHNLTQITDAESKLTKYYYDKLSRLRGMDGPDASSSWSYDGNSVDVLYEYDDLGNLTTKKDAQGTVNYTYDDLYRLTRITHSPDGSTWPDTVRLTYDVVTGAPSGLDNPKGRLWSLVTAGIDSTKYFYDDQGRLGLKRVNLTGCSGEKEITYKYNDADRCTLLNISPSYKTNYHYNALGYLKDIGSLVNTIKYQAAGQMVKIQYPATPLGAVTDTITYDSRLRPTKIKSYKGATNFVNLTYLYQDNSNVDSIIDSVVINNRQKYDYDVLNRLTNVTCPNGNQSFTYDKTGNRASKSGTNYSYYSSTNRLQQDHRGYKYYYDNSGNILRHRQGSPETTIDSFAYDWNNRLIYYKKMSSGAYCEFTYNASGLRIKKQYNDPGSGNADTIYYLYDGINPIAEYGPDGTLLTRYVYAGGMHIAKIAGADTVWYHGDALGSTRKMTKEDGTGYDWAATYYPFGEMTPTGNGANTHGFTGKEFDSEMGLNYFCLRYYDPQIGRFMTLDPFGGYVELPQSQNRYAYVMNNPLKYIDPLGLNGDDDYPFLGWIEGVEARARRYYELWYATSRGRGSGQDEPGRPPPELLLTREDLVYLHMIPGWMVDENGNVVRILPEQNLSDKLTTMPSAPSYGSTPAVTDVLSYGVPTEALQMYNPPEAYQTYTGENVEVGISLTLGVATRSWTLGGSSAGITYPPTFGISVDIYHGLTSLPSVEVGIGSRHFGGALLWPEGSFVFHAGFFTGSPSGYVTTYLEP